jgi:dienelactone hydrolase
VTDYSAKGPFTVKVDAGVGPGGGYLVVRPDPLEADPFGDGGFLYSPIIFGPGIGQQASLHTELLTYFASHGFVVVGTPVLNEGPGGAQNRKSMLDGLSWILSQNEAAGSIYEGKLYVERAVSMGYSVGGTSAVEIGGEPSVHTVVSIHGHTADAELHGTMLQTTGTKDTVGMPLQQNTYEASMVPTFLATLTDADHGYINGAAGGNERPAIVAWMRYWVYGDEGARGYMFGADCALCKSPWENPQRKNWVD